MFDCADAGKTALLYRWSSDQYHMTTSTPGYNVENVGHKLVRFTFWDVGDSERNRRLYKMTQSRPDAIVYVVDASNRDRLEEARDDLKTICEDSFFLGLPLLVISSKQDIGTSSDGEIVSSLGLQQLSGCRWYVTPVSAMNATNLQEPLDWLADETMGRSSSTYALTTTSSYSASSYASSSSSSSSTSSSSSSSSSSYSTLSPLSSSSSSSDASSSFLEPLV